jgi:hypothetical protein
MSAAYESASGSIVPPVGSDADSCAGGLRELSEAEKHPTCRKCGGGGVVEGFTDHYSHEWGHYTREWSYRCDCGGVPLVTECCWCEAPATHATEDDEPICARCAAAQGLTGG